MAHPTVLLGFLKNVVRYLNREREQLLELASQHFGGEAPSLPEFDLLGLAEGLERAFGDRGLLEGDDQAAPGVDIALGSAEASIVPGVSAGPGRPNISPASSGVNPSADPAPSAREQAYQSVSLMLPLRALLDKRRREEERLLEARLTKAVALSTTLYEEECQGLERRLEESGRLLQQAREELEAERQRRAEEAAALRAMGLEYEDLALKHQRLQGDAMRLVHAVAAKEELRPSSRSPARVDGEGVEAGPVAFRVSGGGAGNANGGGSENAASLAQVEQSLGKTAKPESN